jgi:two-component sensor histidine kinase
MHALARANDLLSGDRWSSASSSLRSVIEQALLPHIPAPERLQISGDDVRLTSKTGIAFILAMHELETNPVKYGSWSNLNGNVSVSWDSVAHAGEVELTLCWRETGGPPVARPTRRGFGTRLIHHGLAAELSGKVDLDFDPAGLTCTVQAMLPNPREP